MLRAQRFEINVGWNDESTQSAYWIRPGAAAQCLSASQYATFETRVSELAAQQGYRLVGDDADTPSRFRRYLLARPADDPSTVGGQHLEQIARQLRALPPSELTR